MKYKDWLITWLDNYVKPIAKNKTYMRYSEIVFQRLIPFLGDHDMEEIKPLIIQKYITVLLNSGNLKTGKGLSANTINSILNVIKDSLTVAYNIGLLEQI